MNRFWYIVTQVTINGNSIGTFQWVIKSGNRYFPLIETEKAVASALLKGSVITDPGSEEVIVIIINQCEIDFDDYEAYSEDFKLN